MKVKEVIKAFELVGNTPDTELVITWFGRPPGMSAQRWSEVCKMFDEAKEGQVLQLNIHWWIQDQRDEISNLFPKKTEGEQNNATAGPRNEG